MYSKEKTFSPSEMEKRAVEWCFTDQGQFFLISLTSKLHFANATVNRERRVRALVLQNHPKSILKIIGLGNNKVWCTKRHFSNLDVENFERMKIKRY
jgi:hypothetical protein